MGPSPGWLRVCPGPVVGPWAQGGHRVPHFLGPTIILLPSVLGLGLGEAVASWVLL